MKSGGYLRTSLARAHRPAPDTRMISWQIPRLAVATHNRRIPEIHEFGPSAAAHESNVQPRNEIAGSSRTNVRKTRELDYQPESNDDKNVSGGGMHPQRISTPTHVSSTLTNPVVARPGESAPLTRLRGEPEPPANTAKAAPAGALKEKESGTRVESVERPHAKILEKYLEKPATTVITDDKSNSRTTAPAVKESETRAPRPEFRVNWPGDGRSLSASIRARAERDVIRAVRAEFGRRVEGGTSNPVLPAVIDIRVEHLTVKVETHAASEPAQPPRPAAPSSGDSAFASHFLRRTITGF